LHQNENRDSESKLRKNQNPGIAARPRSFAAVIARDKFVFEIRSAVSLSRAGTAASKKSVENAQRRCEFQNLGLWDLSATEL
jgi:hypothetical protein